MVEGARPSATSSPGAPPASRRESGRNRGACDRGARRSGRSGRRACSAAAGPVSRPRGPAAARRSSGRSPGSGSPVLLRNVAPPARASARRSRAASRRPRRPWRRACWPDSDRGVEAQALADPAHEPAHPRDRVGDAERSRWTSSSDTGSVGTPSSPTSAITSAERSR